MGMLQQVPDPYPLFIASTKATYVMGLREPAVVHPVGKPAHHGGRRCRHALRPQPRPPAGPASVSKPTRDRVARHAARRGGLATSSQQKVHTLGRLGRAPTACCCSGYGQRPVTVHAGHGESAETDQPVRAVRAKTPRMYRAPAEPLDICQLFSKLLKVQSNL